MGLQRNFDSIIHQIEKLRYLKMKLLNEATIMPSDRFINEASDHPDGYGSI